MSSITFVSVNSEQTKYRLTAEFTLAEWIEIRADLNRAWRRPTSRLSDAITDMISQAERVYWPESSK